MIEKSRETQDNALAIAGDFIVNIDTAEDAQGLIQQLQDAIGKGA